jgi:opacity protein-like surface antigen
MRAPKNERARMGFVKLVAAVGIVTLCSVAANAAELPPLPEAPALPVPESAGNWYVRGDIGGANYATSRWTQALTGLAPGDQSVSGFTSKSIRPSAFAGAGIGYELHPWIRADIAVEYRASSGLRGAFQERVFNPSPPLAFLGQSEFAGSLQTTAVMANAYGDLGTWYGFTPYLGAGIGFARHDLSGVTGSGFAATGPDFTSGNAPNGASMPVAFNTAAEKSKTNLAWSLMAGLSYSISPKLKLDLGYRHLDLGDIPSGSITCFCRESSTGFKARNVASNEIRLGVRWLFGEAGPALGAADELPEVPR